MLYMIWFCSFQSCFNSLLIHSTRWPVFFPWWSIHVSKLLYLALFSRYSGTLVWEINPYSKIQFRNWNIKTSEYVYTYKIDQIHNHLYKRWALPYWLFCCTPSDKIWVINGVDRTVKGTQRVHAIESDV